MYTERTNHNDVAITIHKMVFNRLSFLPQTEANASLISNYIVEVCNVLEFCFKVSLQDVNGEKLEAEDVTRVGVESNYTTGKKSIIADFVSIYLLRMDAGMGASSSSKDATTGEITTDKGIYLKKAEAGSVSVEYSQRDASKGGSLAMNTEELIKHLEKSAFTKGLRLGCVLDICSECVKEYNKLQKPIVNFKIIPS